jgi:hypothetical protein
MRYRAPEACVAAAIVLVASAISSLAEAPRDKNVWNYDGGVVLLTNGSIPNGPCFRISGRMTAPGFFDSLKRIDGEHGATFRRGPETVTQFPDHVLLSFSVRDFYDQTCPAKVENAGASPYLTRAVMSSLNLSFYWKHGVELRPITGVESKFFSVEPVIPYAGRQARGLPQKFEWSYQFLVPSAGVPLTDSLVLVMRTDDGHIAARVAARL